MAWARRVHQAPARPSATNRLDRTPGGAAGMSFRLSFHQALLGPTGAHWLDDPPDVSCKDSTRQYAVDGSRLSCKQQVGGSSPPASSTARSAWALAGCRWAGGWPGPRSRSGCRPACCRSPRTGCCSRPWPVPPATTLSASGPPDHPDPDGEPVAASINRSRPDRHRPRTDKRARSCAGPPGPPKCRSGPSARGYAGVDVGAPSPRPARQRRTSRPSRCGRARRARARAPSVVQPPLPAAPACA